MSAKRINLKGWACTCERCGHMWTSVGDELPLRCAGPQCKSPYWNRPRAAGAKPARKK